MGGILSQGFSVSVGAGVSTSEHYRRGQLRASDSQLACRCSAVAPSALDESCVRLPLESCPHPFIILSSIVFILHPAQIAFLHRFFPTGSAHVLGPLTSDHWVVFVADYCERPPTESTDVTLDIKMFDICDGMSRLLHEDQAVEEAAKAGVQLGSKSKAPSAKSGKEEEEEEDSPGAASQGSDAGDSPVSTDSDSKEAPAEGEGGEEGGEPKGMDEREEEEKGGAAGGGKGDKSCADLGKLAACPGPSSAVAKYVTQRSGLTAVLPGSTVHAYMFEPCGYSANGLLDGSYWTVHVTPEKHCSYASFETNVRASSLRPLVRAVLALFRPKRFTLTLFADAQGVKEMTDLPVEPYIKCQEEVAKEAERQGQAGLGPVSQGEDPQRWKLTDKSHTEFAGDYCVVLANYRDVRSPPSRVLSPAVKASFGAAVAGGQGQGGASGAAAEAEDSPAIAAAAGLSQGTGVQAVPSKAGTGKDAASGSGSSIGGAASLGLAAGAGTGARAAASSSEPVSRAVGEGVALPGHVSLPHGGPGGS